MGRVVPFCALLATVAVACSKPPSPPPVQDEALRQRIIQLVDRYTSAADDAGEQAVLADARRMFEEHGVPTIKQVGDEAAYEFVFLNAAGQKPPFLQLFLDAVRDPAVSHDVPAEARAFVDRQARQMSAGKKAPTQPPSMPALRDEINAMMAADQAVRQKEQFDFQKLMEQDKRTAGPLKAIFDRYGVPTYDMVGIDAAKAFVVMVQHQSPELRAAVLPKLRANVDAGQAEAEMYAMVYDRTQGDQGRAQRYGQNFVCKDGRFEPAPIEDPEHVDERRAEVGLMRLSMYARILKANSPPICESVKKANPPASARKP
jgi:hypothetical protein